MTTAWLQRQKPAAAPELYRYIGRRVVAGGTITLLPGAVMNVLVVGTLRPAATIGPSLMRFVLRDALPANTTFSSASSATSGALLTYHRVGDPAGAYTATALAAASIDAVAFMVPQLDPGVTLGAAFSVIVHANATGTLYNTAYADFTAAGVATTVNSNLVQLPLPALAPTILFFTSTAYTTTVNQTRRSAPRFTCRSTPRNAIPTLPPCCSDRSPW